MFQLGAAWRAGARCFCWSSCGQTVTGTVTGGPQPWFWGQQRTAIDDIPPFPLRMLCREAQGFTSNSLSVEKCSCSLKCHIQFKCIKSNQFSSPSPCPVVLMAEGRKGICACWRHDVSVRSLGHLADETNIPQEG